MSKQFDSLSLEERKAAFERVGKAHPDCIPVIVKPGGPEGTFKEKLPMKYLLPFDAQALSLMQKIRNSLKLLQEEALFFFIETKGWSGVNVVLLQPMTLMADLQKQYAQEDGFVYIRFFKENTFG